MFIEKLISYCVPRMKAIDADITTNGMNFINRPIIVQNQETKDLIERL